MTRGRPLAARARRLHERIRFLVTLIRKLLPLAASSRDRALMVLACGVLAVSRSLPEGLVRLRVRVRYCGRVMRWAVADMSELEALAEVLGDESYAVSAALAPRTIVDLGSHVGSSILYFRCRYPEARIVGVEAHPKVFARLRRNVGDLPGVELLNVAVGARDGRTRFYPSRRTWGSTGRADVGGDVVIDVEQRSLDSLLGELAVDHVDLLKIDIEGMEYETLAAWSGLQARVGAIVGEFHAFIPAVAPQERAFFALLEGFEVERERDGQLFRAYR
jgi:FkbM family methyltransferase